MSERELEIKVTPSSGSQIRILLHRNFPLRAIRMRLGKLDLPQNRPDQRFSALNYFWKSFEILHSFLQPPPGTMNSLPRLLSGLASKDAAWVCSSCAKSARQRPSTSFFKPSMRRNISESSKPRQNAVPTMEQLRAPFQKKNSTTMYYAISIILGTVAFSYGSVPMYKMVRSFLTTPTAQS